MDVDLLKRNFRRIGAELEIDGPQPWQRPQALLDVREERGDERFRISLRERAGVEFEVISLDPRRRHLLLLERDGGKKHKFLCGHDERHWFVAGIPETARGVTSVRTAFEALQPQAVREMQSSRPVEPGEHYSRRNRNFVRQGEWFFVPRPEMQVPAPKVLRDEPLSRGRGSKPHIMEYCYREGGELVYVCRRYRWGLTERAHDNLLRRDPRARAWDWSTMRRDPDVYAMGRIRHADHATVALDGWHRVYMNTEHKAQGSAKMRMLD